MANNNKLAPQFITLVVLSSCLPHSTTQATNENNGLIAAGVIVAGVVVARATWKLCPKADRSQAVLNDCQTTHDKIAANYAPAIKMMATQDPRTFSEPFLSSCTGLALTTELRTIGSSIGKLAGTISTVKQALEKAKNTATRNELQAHLEKLTTLQTQLNKVETSVRIHQPYFNLSAMLDNISSEHVRDLQLLEKYPHLKSDTLPCPDATAALHADLNAMLNLQCNAYADQLAYPYVSYAQQTSKAINDLDQAVARTYSVYPIVSGQAKNLAANLLALQKCVVNHPEHEKNKQAREKNLIVKKKLGLQKDHYQALEDIERERVTTEKARAQTELERLNLEQNSANRIGAIEMQLKSLQIESQRRIHAVETGQQHMLTQQHQQATCINTHLQL